MKEKLGLGGGKLLALFPWHPIAASAWLDLLSHHTHHSSFPPVNLFFGMDPPNNNASSVDDIDGFAAHQCFARASGIDGIDRRDIQSRTRTDRSTPTIFHGVDPDERSRRALQPAVLNPMMGPVLINDIPAGVRGGHCYHLRGTDFAFPPTIAMPTATVPRPASSAAYFDYLERQRIYHRFLARQEIAGGGWLVPISGVVVADHVDYRPSPYMAAAPPPPPDRIIDGTAGGTLPSLSQHHNLRLFQDPLLHHGLLQPPGPHPADGLVLRPIGAALHGYAQYPPEHAASLLYPELQHPRQSIIPRPAATVTASAALPLRTNTARRESNNTEGIVEADTDQDTSTRTRGAKNVSGVATTKNHKQSPGPAPRTTTARNQSPELPEDDISPPDAIVSSATGAQSSSRFSESNRRNQKPPPSGQRTDVTCESPHGGLASGNSADLIIPHYSQRKIVSLSTDQDQNWLSEYLCFVRSELIEVCQANTGDASSRNSCKAIKAGQVGIRCRYCAHVPVSMRNGRSSSYPSSLSRIYQSLTMMLREHFSGCTHVPKELQDRISEFKEAPSQGTADSKRFWTWSAAQLGLVDSKVGGIWFRDSEAAAAAGGVYVFMGKDDQVISLSEKEAEGFLMTSPGSQQRNHNDFAGKEEGIEREAERPLPPVLRVVTKDDKKRISGFLFLLMSQVQLIRMEESERTGNRRGIMAGLPGMGCRRCAQAGRMGMCRVFPVSRRTVCNKVDDIYDHLRRCPLVSKEVKASLASLKSSEEESSQQRSKRETMTLSTEERSFFDRVWQKMQEFDLRV